MHEMGQSDHAVSVIALAVSAGGLVCVTNIEASISNRSLDTETRIFGGRDFFVLEWKPVSRRDPGQRNSRAC
jgi:hypothetical protein